MLAKKKVDKSAVFLFFIFLLAHLPYATEAPDLVTSTTIVPNMMRNRTILMLVPPPYILSVITVKIISIVSRTLKFVKSKAPTIIPEKREI